MKILLEMLYFFLCFGRWKLFLNIVFSFHLNIKTEKGIQGGKGTIRATGCESQQYCHLRNRWWMENLHYGNLVNIYVTLLEVYTFLSPLKILEIPWPSLYIHNREEIFLFISLSLVISAKIIWVRMIIYVDKLIVINFVREPRGVGCHQSVAASWRLDTGKSWQPKEDHWSVQGEVISHFRM